MKDTDHKRELVDYFKKNLKKGYTVDSLTTALTQQGYPRTRVEKAREIANLELAKAAPVIKEKPVIQHEVYDESNHLVAKKSGFFKRISSIFSR